MPDSSNVGLPIMEYAYIAKQKNEPGVNPGFHFHLPKEELTM